MLQKCLIVIMLLPVWAFSQQKDSISTSAKIDSIYLLQKKMYSEAKNTPLSNKNIGVEINPFRLLFIDEMLTVSGSISFFNVNRDAELAFPIYFQKPKDPNDITEFTIDSHFRYFLGNSQNGFFLSCFARFAYLKGALGENYLIYRPETDKIGSESKLGIGFGLGYRVFSYKGLYWGVSISAGRYLIGENDKFSGSFLSIDDDSEFIFDLELLKFGWAF